MFGERHLSGPSSTAAFQDSSANSHFQVRETAPLSDRDWPRPDFPPPPPPPLAAVASPGALNPEPEPAGWRSMQPPTAVSHLHHLLAAGRPRTDSVEAQSDKAALLARGPADYSARTCIPAPLREADPRILLGLQGSHAGDS